MIKISGGKGERETVRKSDELLVLTSGGNSSSASAGNKIQKLIFDFNNGSRSGSSGGERLLGRLLFSPYTLTMLPIIYSILPNFIF